MNEPSFLNKNSRNIVKISLLNHIINLLKITAMRKVNVVIGTMAGVAAGALLGVLLAPDKGTETRKKISTKSKETADSIKNKLGIS